MLCWGLEIGKPSHLAIPLESSDSLDLTHLCSLFAIAAGRPLNLPMMNV